MAKKEEFSDTHKKCFENTFYQIERRLNVLAMIGKQEFSSEKDLIECLYEILKFSS